jgi:hypothetical protein
MCPLSGKWGQLVGKVGEWYMVSQHLQDCSPRLCRLKTDELAPASKYWTYWSHAGDIGPVSLVVGHRQELGLRPLLHWLAQERNWARTRGSVSRRAVDYVGSAFSREQWDLSKFVDHVRYVWSWTIRGLSVESVWHIGWFFTCRVYIDLNHRDSRIWVTACLWQSSRR